MLLSRIAKSLIIMYAMKNYGNPSKGVFHVQPHYFYKFVLIVPNQLRLRSFPFAFVFESPMARFFVPVVLLLSIARKYFRKYAWTSRTNRWLRHWSWSRMFFDTFGIVLGTGGSSVVRAKTRPEKAMIFLASCLSVVAGLLCSGLVFQAITLNTYAPVIDSLAELNKTNFDIIIPNEMDQNLIAWFKSQ